MISALIRIEVAAAAARADRTRRSVRTRRRSPRRSSNVMAMGSAAVAGAGLLVLPDRPGRREVLLGEGHVADLVDRRDALLGQEVVHVGGHRRVLIDLGGVHVD